MTAQHVGDQMGQPMVVDNKPGASLAIAADTVAKAPGDGYTLLIAPDSATVVNPFVYPKLPYNPTRDFQSVALVGKATLVLVVANSLNVNSVPAFVQAAGRAPAPSTSARAASAIPRTWRWSCSATGWAWTSRT